MRQRVFGAALGFALLLLTFALRGDGRAQSMCSMDACVECAWRWGPPRPVCMITFGRRFCNCDVNWPDCDEWGPCVPTY